MSDKKHLERLGFFYRLPEADRVHILTMLSRGEPIQDETAIAEYLDSGLLLAVTPGVEDDPLLPDAPFAGPLHTLTDGRYTIARILGPWCKITDICCSLTLFSLSRAWINSEGGRNLLSKESFDLLTAIIAMNNSRQ
jgi:hypothetical protein